MTTFFILVLAAIAAIVTGLITAAISDPQHRYRPYVAALVPLGLGLLGVQAYLANRPADPPVPAPSASAAGASAPDATAASDPMTEASSNTGSETPSADPQPVMATSLMDLPIVESNTNSSIDLDAVGTIEIDGGTYGRALVYSCAYFCNGTSPQTQEVTLSRKFTLFTTTAAVLDTHSGEYRIDFTLDALPPRSFTTSPGNPTPIEIDVSDVSRMRIEMFSAGELKSPIQAGADTAIGENGGGLPGVALGDPLFLP